METADSRVLHQSIDTVDIGDRLNQFAQRCGGGELLAVFEKVTDTLRNKFVIDARTLLGKHFTLDQMTTILKEAGMKAQDAEGCVSSLETYFCMSFDPAPPAPPIEKVVHDNARKSMRRISKFAKGTEDVPLGQLLTQSNMMNAVALSPLTPGLVQTANPKVNTLTKNEVRAVVKEEVINTLRVYSRVNVDVIYLGKKADLLDEEYPLLPKHGKNGPVKKWYWLLFHKFNNARKGIEKSLLGELSRDDLSQEAIDIIELGFPVRIVDRPSAYLAIEENVNPQSQEAPARATNDMNNDTNGTGRMPLALTTAGGADPAAGGTFTLGSSGRRGFTPLGRKRTSEAQDGEGAAHDGVDRAGAPPRASPETHGADAGRKRSRTSKGQVAETEPTAEESLDEQAAEEQEAEEEVAEEETTAEDEQAVQEEAEPFYHADYTAMEYAAELEAKGARIAVYFPERQVWLVGEISTLNYRGSKWGKFAVEANEFIKGHPHIIRPKDKKKSPYIEISSIFVESDHGKTWTFIEKNADYIERLVAA